MNELAIGRVTHYYDHLGVAAVALSAELRVGDRVHVVGHTTDETATIDRMQIEHRDVTVAKPGDDVAVHLGVKVREHDELRRVN